VEEAYTQQGRAHIRRLHPDWAARPALMRRAAHAVESKAVGRIEVAVSPRPCLGCAVELWSISIIFLVRPRVLPLCPAPGSCPPVRVQGPGPRGVIWDPIGGCVPFDKLGLEI
jgi:hypothetical protein